RFFVSAESLPGVLALPSWDELRPGLAAAVRTCRELGIGAQITQRDGIPLCTLHDRPELHDVFRFDPKRRLALAPRAVREGVCEGCAASAQCPGVLRSHRDAHGDAGLVAYPRKPATLYVQRTPGAPAFTVE